MTQQNASAEHATSALQGFVDESTQSNDVFRICLSALSRPGSIHALDTQLGPLPLLFPTATALLLTLADFETKIWLDQDLSAEHDVTEFLRFHTGAGITTATERADFAVISNTATMPPFETFMTGTDDYPDRSTTLIIQVDALQNSGTIFAGPGIKTEIAFSVAPEPRDFAGQLVANRAKFPCGVDLIFATQTQIAALPRSVKLIAEG